MNTIQPVIVNTLMLLYSTYWYTTYTSFNPPTNECVGKDVFVSVGARLGEQFQTERIILGHDVLNQANLIPVRLQRIAKTPQLASCDSSTTSPTHPPRRVGEMFAQTGCNNGAS